MKNVKEDCFAYKEFSGIPYCNALKNISCKNCKFYKESFRNYDDYMKALEKYTNKYGKGYLEDFEEDEE